MKGAGDVLMLIAAAALITSPFLYQYWTGGRWRKSPTGIHLMAYMSVFSLVMCFAVAGFLSGHNLPPVVRPLVWLLVGFVAWWRIVVMYQSTHRRDE